MNAKCDVREFPCGIKIVEMPGGLKHIMNPALTAMLVIRGYMTDHRDGTSDWLKQLKIRSDLTPAQFEIAENLLDELIAINKKYETRGRRLEDVRLMTAALEGRNAFHTGKNMFDDCPYVAFSALRNEWQKGFVAAKEQANL